MKQLRFFEEFGIGTCVFLAEEESSEEYLQIDEQGVLVIPDTVKPTGFHLVLVIPEESRVVIIQKNVGQERGGYHRDFLSQLPEFAEGFVSYLMHDPIEVTRVGKNIWTAWHKLKPNRVDCWQLEKNGKVTLFQVGVVTHDNGQTFRLLGECRWQGRLFQDEDKIVGKPDDPKWGSFDVRRSILDVPDMQRLLKEAKFQPWNGQPTELDPPLDPVPASNLARIQWYIPFAGQTGQGPANLHDGTTAWVHGIDILDSPDPDGIKRLQRNDLVSFTGTASFGAKKRGPPKLLNVQRV